MRKYGKIVCGALRVPQIYPGYIVVEGKKIYNPSVAQLLAAGYLPIYETTPEEREGKIAVAKYEVSADGTRIVQVWEYEDIPEPSDETPTEETNEE
jgi:hypothetical protein